MPRTRALNSVQSLTVLITGAAQGMGENFARQAAREGAARLILWDINEPLLLELARELGQRHPGLTVEPRRVDLCDEQAIGDAVRAALQGGAPHVLVNNAGLVTGQPFIDHDTSQIRQIMEVNTLAPMLLTRKLLPGMIALEEPARILTMASAAGLVSNPKMSVYAASKAAALAWSDSLRLEMERTAGNQVSVTTFCPTYVKTGMFAGVRKMLLTPIMEPQQVTDRAWRAMLAGTPLVLMPWTSKLGQMLRGMLPRVAWDYLAEHVLGVYRSMDGFTGRKSATGTDTAGPEDVR